MNYVIAIDKRKDPLPKKLRYLVMIFSGKETTKKQSMMDHIGLIDPSTYSGFLGEQPHQTIGQFFTGREKKGNAHGTIVQLPKVFKSEKQAREGIRLHKKMNYFKENNIYQIIPIDII